MRLSTPAHEQTSDLMLGDAGTLGAAPLPQRREVSCSEFQRGAGDQEAFLVEHMTMVRFVARNIHARLPQHVELEDLVSAGVVGLMDAAARFDWAKQTQFKSYAQIRIRGAILDSLRVLDWSPRELRRKGRAMAEAIRALSARLGRSPGDAEIAAEMEMDLHAYRQMTGELEGLEIGSLNVERSEDMGDEELDFLQAPAEENPLSVYMRGQQRQRLVEAIGALPDKERLVLTLYYLEEMTLREVGLALGVVESRVSQLRWSALGHLRSLLGVPRTEKRRRS